MRITANKVSVFLLSLTILLSGNLLTVKAASIDVNNSNSEVVKEFDVFYPNDTNDIREEATIVPNSHITYKATQTGKTSEIGDYTGQSTSGDPGVTVSLSQMKATTFSASSNVAFNVKSIAQSTLGFNFSKSYTIGHSGSVKVPTYHNGKAVKRAEIQAYRLYDNYTFKVTWTSIHVKTPQYYGSYWAKKPSGYHYKVVYYY